MRDHTDGHYNTLFAEQLTRPFEVLVLDRSLSPNLEIMSKFRLDFIIKYVSVSSLPTGGVTK